MYLYIWVPRVRMYTSVCVRNGVSKRDKPWQRFYGRRGCNESNVFMEIEKFQIINVQ